MIPWDKLHGAMTHFPIALLLFSTACDFVSFTFKKLPFARGLRLVSFYGLAVAALASLGAVVSGIALTKGDLWGRGDLGWHHNGSRHHVGIHLGSDIYCWRNLSESQRQGDGTWKQAGRRRRLGGQRTKFFPANLCSMPWSGRRWE